MFVQKEKVQGVTKVIEANAIDEQCKSISAELELLIDILNSLKIEDTTQATKIIEKISVIFALLNEVRAQLKRKIDSLRTNESIAEFHAQLTLLDQSIINFLELCNSPEKCNEYHSKVSVQVEELESKFADFDDFILKIADKREEIYKAFDTQKTQLVEQINRRTNALEQIGVRILKNIENKSSSFQTKEEILSFEMADNVMLYLDDIQHCSAEFLQNFISLADGQRKMDGIFEGESKTYDLRGKRFCIIMAGNPYTESGEEFQIPDMLANRAETYNLGDVIGNTDHLFKLSLLENAIAKNSYFQQLSSTSFDDFYRLINHIETQSEDTLSLEVDFSNQEIETFTTVLKKAIIIRDLVLKVNQQYILSASMDQAYRTEPAFKLQGSYRDMNKMLSKVVPLMNDKEIEELILTHYENESQTLTSDTEANLLKLKELANQLSQTERERWEDIKSIFLKQNKLGFAGKDNQAAQVLGQLMDFNQNLESIAQAIKIK